VERVTAATLDLVMMVIVADSLVSSRHDQPQAVTATDGDPSGRATCKAIDPQGARHYAVAAVLIPGARYSPRSIASSVLSRQPIASPPI
jgi:hypothetical protein